VQGKKILIAEDNELNLRLFIDLLEMKGAEVKAVSEGKKFFDLAKEFLPNLIIMDIQLRDVSGLDLIKEVKSHAETSQIPIVAVTAFAMKDDAEKILKSGCEAYISKPVAIDNFFNVVQKFLEKGNQAI
jgi:two-component system cell cycle response regulator DivK